MQWSVNLFVYACVDCELATNPDKTLVMYQPPSSAAHNVARILINGTQLKTVDNFVYLGSPLEDSLHLIKSCEDVCGKIERTAGAQEEARERQDGGGTLREEPTEESDHAEKSLQLALRRWSWESAYGHSLQWRRMDAIGIDQMSEEFEGDAPKTYLNEF
ncbi:hypothetical protein SprV_0100317400 [Sparganum proliferum]